MRWPWHTFHRDNSDTVTVDEEDETCTIRAGPLVIHPHRHEVLVRGKPAKLTAMDLAILQLLARRPGVVFSLHDIADACEPGSAAQQRTITRRVQLLRQRLGDAGSLIVNMRGAGYCLRLDKNDLPHARWWSIAPLVGWWEAQQRPQFALGATTVFAGVLVAAMFLGTATWAGHRLLFPAAAGVRQVLASSWSPPNGSGTDPFERVQHATEWSGIGSAIAHREADQYLILSDRGYEDAKVDPVCRVHTVRIARDTSGLLVEWLHQTPLTDESGGVLTGGPDDLANRYDPEALARDSMGNLWIADEYGPAIDMFSSDGRRLRRLPVPDHYRVARPNREPDRERRDNNQGRLPNRGFESLALVEEAGIAFALPQSPLCQDGGEGGRHLRLLEISLDGRHSREFVYQLESSGHQVSDVLALDAHRLLVLERDSAAGGEAVYKRINLIDTRTATDVSGSASLPADKLPADIQPVRKRPFLNLLDCLPVNDHQILYEQIEGMAIAPDTAGGSCTLILTSDNGREGAHSLEPMSVYSITIDEAMLR